MSTRTKIWRSVILTLVAIGLIVMLITETTLFLGILAAVILIWYLYRRPPRWLIRLSHPQAASPARKPGASTRKAKLRERKKRRFRVIDGNGNRSSNKTKMP
ncbi:intracellular growth attenuator family protein [Kroppenstedtia eburnea]|uniref:intracellular growth attenuator family protein n=1 Tax=Kroppenstedtia eburnea TaxID=714067 RepID=UPI001179E4B2|nr:intracellular growth attenuator family protein [Kroppenstedtia eburnea]QKI81923.1 intracellular growth attenuator family protein [Kroppenstedtia eburnea]